MVLSVEAKQGSNLCVFVEIYCIMSLLEFLSTVDATRTVEFVGEALELLALVEITDATHLAGAVVAG